MDGISIKKGSQNIAHDLETPESSVVPKGRLELPPTYVD
jgi:hypothetical protein